MSLTISFYFIHCILESNQHAPPPPISFTVFFPPGEDNFNCMHAITLLRKITINEIQA